MESVDIQLKIQALEILSDSLKTDLAELKNDIKLVDETSKTKRKDFEESLKEIIEKIANDKKSTSETTKNDLRELEEKLEKSIFEINLKSQSMDNDIIARVSKIETIFSFEGIAKRVLFLASIFGAIQVLVQYATRLFK